MSQGVLHEARRSPLDAEVRDERADAIEPPLPTFACNDCHRVQRFTRIGTRGWNKMIGHVSGGLLYGAEVPRPAWLTHDRKRPFAPRPCFFRISSRCASSSAQNVSFPMSMR